MAKALLTGRMALSKLDDQGGAHIPELMAQSDMSGESTPRSMHDQ